MSISALTSLALCLLIASGVRAPGVPPMERAARTALQSDTGASRTVRFTTTAGTWMSLDVSPDGRAIVFDLLGDLYTLPVTGGRARPLTTGPAWDGQPRFAPDGRSIALVSDRSGMANVWVVDRNGQRARQISDVASNVNDSPISSPSWSPDGRTIVVSQRWGTDKRVRFAWDTGGGWMLRLRPRIGAVQPSTWVLAQYDVTTRRSRWLIDTTNTLLPTLGPAFTPDGRTLFAATQLYPMDYSGAIAYWRIDRIDLESGARMPEMGRALARSSIRPTVSHTGRFLAYLSPSGSRYGLRLRDLRTQHERWLVVEQIDPPPLSADVAGRIGMDLAPGYAFTPDDKAVIIGFGGRIHQIEIASGRRWVIPFAVDVERELAPMTVHQFTLPDTAVHAQSVMHPALSHDGRRVAFSSLGRVWVMTLPWRGDPGGALWPLTNDSLGEAYPSWSPDGRWIAYSAWQPGVGGMVRRAWVGEHDRTELRPSERLTSDTAAYHGVAVAPDGRRVVAVRTVLSPSRRTNPFTVLDASSTVRDVDSTDLVGLSITGGRATVIRSVPFRLAGPEAMSRLPTEQLYFTEDNDRIRLGLTSLTWEGKDRRADLVVVDSSAGSDRERSVSGVLAPNERRALVTHYATLYDVRLPASNSTTDSLDLEVAMGGALGTGDRIARSWGRAYAPWITWAGNGRRALFAQGGTLFLAEVPDTGWITFDRVEVPLKVPVDIPSGTLVLRGARLLTMQGLPGAPPVVFPRGDLVVRNNRIAAIGPSGTVPIPEGATVMDMTGKTILPGYVDIHDHTFPPYGVHQGQWWAGLVRLAHGVTAVRDPGEVDLQFGDFHRLRDLERMGELIGPRLFTAGVIHYRTFVPITSPEHARALVHPNAAYFHTETFKEYSSEPWPSRRLVALAAGAAGLNATTHGDHLRAVVDGFSGMEHNLDIPIYDDVATLVAKSGTTLTNTFGVTAAAFSAVLASGDEPWAHRRMRRFVPPSARGFLSAKWRAGVATLGRQDASNLNALLASAAAITARGGRVAMGMHGNIPGVGLHYELWFHALGGMSPYDALRSATIIGATAIGHGNDLGSLEVGKLADLQILQSNPLTDIRNTVSIQYVMKNGRLYDADDLTEIWPRHRALPSFYLYDDGAVPSAVSAGEPAAEP